MTKKIATMLWVAFCFLATVNAQSKKELSALLSSNMEAYRVFTLAGNFDSSFQYMPPKMFEVVPRDSLLAYMKNAMDNEYMTINMTRFDVKTEKKFKIKKAGVYFWTFIPYEAEMDMILKGESGFKSLMISMMKSKFGEGNVTEKGESGMTIRLVKKQLIAFKDPALPIWSILEDKRPDKGQEGDMQAFLLETVIPEEVRKAMKR